MDAFMWRMPARHGSGFKKYGELVRLDPKFRCELLGRTEAKLPSDGFSVVDPLDLEADRCELTLEVAGHRYCRPEIAFGLGDDVELVAEPDNSKDPFAVIVRANGQKIGYMNRLQAQPQGDGRQSVTSRPLSNG